MSQVKVWDGSNWKTSDLGEAVLWNGSAWTYPRLKYWDGQGWVTSVGVPDTALATFSSEIFAPATSGISFVSNGAVQEMFSELGGTFDISQWIDTTSANGSNYQVHATVVSGSVSGAATGSWLTLSSNRNWYVTVDNGTASATLTIKIRVASTTSNVSSTTVTMQAFSDYDFSP